MIKHKVLFLINSVHYFCNSLYNLYKSYDKTELSSEHKEIKCLGKSIYFKVLSLDFTKKEHQKMLFFHVYRLQKDILYSIH